MTEQEMRREIRAALAPLMAAIEQIAARVEGRRVSRPRLALVSDGPNANESEVGDA